MLYTKPGFSMAFQFSVLELFLSPIEFYIPLFPLDELGVKGGQCFGAKSGKSATGLAANQTSIHILT